MVAAVLAGTAAVHCGTTEFAVAGDAGSDGRSKSGSQSSSASTSASSSVSTSESASATSSLSSSGSGSRVDAGSCTLPSKCPTGDVCCVPGPDESGFCSATECVAPDDESCGVPADCGKTAVCCVDTTKSPEVGVCEKVGHCAGEQKCDPTHPCPAGDPCSGGLCSVATTGDACALTPCPAGMCGTVISCGATGQCMCPSSEVCPSGRDAGELQECCTPYTCAHYTANGECGSNLTDGCGGALSTYCHCANGATCLVQVADMPGACP